MTSLYIVLFVLFFLTSLVKTEFEELVQEIENKLWDSKIFTDIERVFTNSLGFLNQGYTVVNPSPSSQTYVEKIMAAGYKFEDHKVITEDGYILSIWRIPGKIGETNQQGKKPVFFLHGLLDDSYTWIVLNPNNSLPMMLSDHG
jgi:hypothetical protein